MREFLRASLDAVLAMPVDVVLVGIFLAFLLALPVAGVHIAARRGSKDPAMPLIVSSMASILVGMALASGQVWQSAQQPGGIDVSTPREPTGRPPQEEDLTESLAWIIFEKADVNRDWSISSDEAAALGDQFVKTFAGPGKDSIDLSALSEAFRAYGQLARVNRKIAGGNLEEAYGMHPKAAPAATRKDGAGGR